jgi:hypothetical protein
MPGTRGSKIAIAFVLFVSGAHCGGGPSEMFAPRFPGAARPPTSPEKVQIVGAGRPSCDYEVIGTVFTRGSENFAKMAASVGGDGVYDTRCQLRTEQHMIFAPTAERVAAANGIAGTPSSVTGFQTTNSDCAARVFVCKGAR